MLNKRQILSFLGISLIIFSAVIRLNITELTFTAPERLFYPGSGLERISFESYSFSLNDDNENTVNNSEPTHTRAVWTGFRNPSAILVHDDIVFIADLSGIYVWEISEDGLNLPISHITYSNISVARMDLVDGILYVLDKEMGLIIFNVSDPFRPILSGSFYGGVFSEPKAIHNYDSYIYIADARSGLWILELDPNKPEIIGNYYDNANLTDYEADGASFNLCIIEGINDEEGKEDGGDLLVAVADWNDGTEILDVSEPSAPVELCEINNLKDIECTETSDESTDNPDSNLQSEIIASDVEAFGQFLFIGTLSQGVLIYRMDCKNGVLTFKFEGTIPVLNGRVYNLEIWNDLLFVAAGLDGVQIYDISQIATGNIMRLKGNILPIMENFERSINSNLENGAEFEPTASIYSKNIFIKRISDEEFYLFIIEQYPSGTFLSVRKSGPTYGAIISNYILSTGILMIAVSSYLQYKVLKYRKQFSELIESKSLHPIFRKAAVDATENDGIKVPLSSRSHERPSQMDLQTPGHGNPTFSEIEDTLKRIKYIGDYLDLAPRGRFLFERYIKKRSDDAISSLYEYYRLSVEDIANLLINGRPLDEHMRERLLHEAKPSILFLLERKLPESEPILKDLRDKFKIRMDSGFNMY